MNPWLTALDGLGTVSAVMTPVFLWDYFRHRRRRVPPAAVHAAPAPRRPAPVTLENTGAAMPFDSAVVIDADGARLVRVEAGDE